MDTNSSQDVSGGRRVAVLGGLRTPWVKVGTGLENVHATELARLPAEELILRLGVSLDQIDQVIFGNVSQPADAKHAAATQARWRRATSTLPEVSGGFPASLGSR